MILFSKSCRSWLLALFMLLLAVNFSIPALSKEKVTSGPSNAPARAVILQGTRNTRDLGGIKVKGGYLAKGLLYRSGALCYINDSDIAKLNKLKIKTVVDLRTEGERRREGLDKEGFTSHLNSNLHLPMYSRKGLGREAYFSFLDKHDWASIGRFFRTMAEKDNLPLLYHCSAGKDRTGILTALTLSLLGAQRQVIMDDYLQSQRNSAALVVDPTWIEAVFKTIDGAGGCEAYLRSIGVPAQTFPAIRQNLIKAGDSARSTSTAHPAK